MNLLQQHHQYKMNLVKSTSLFLATIHVTNAREEGKLRGVTAVSINYYYYINLTFFPIICSHIICILSASLMSMCTMYFQYYPLGTSA